MPLHAEIRHVCVERVTVSHLFSCDNFLVDTLNLYFPFFSHILSGASFPSTIFSAQTLKQKASYEIIFPVVSILCFNVDKAVLYEILLMQYLNLVGG